MTPLDPSAGAIINLAEEIARLSPECAERRLKSSTSRAS